MVIGIGNDAPNCVVGIYNAVGKVVLFVISTDFSTSIIEKLLKYSLENSYSINMI